jgi:ectoine hydroxylase-related dioxygenase (phytanoyl-CoA dioxygenase family)
MKKMPKKLTPEQLAAYEEDGYVDKIDIFTEAEVEALVAELSEAEANFPDQLDAAGRNNAHYVLPVLDKITHDARILDAVEDIIGPNILIVGTTLFIKEPETKGFVSWHQDARYIGLEPHNWVTGWVALGDVSLENGCMQMIPGSHKAPLIEHIDTFGEDNILTRGQTVPDVDEACARPVAMKAGQLSLHHPRIVHGSGPNLSKRRRLGFAIQSFIAPNVDQVIGKNWAQLARGEDRFGYHGNAARPHAPMLPKDLAFRDNVNNELSEIFYAGAAKKGKY